MRDGLLADSEQYRAKAESKKLLDLAQTVDEKYGQARGWELSLRKNFNLKTKDTEEYF